MSDALNPTEARRLACDALLNGHVRYSRHAKDRMVERKIVVGTIHNVLRGGQYLPPERDVSTGDWKYSVVTNHYKVVLALLVEEDEQNVVLVITVIRRNA